MINNYEFIKTFLDFSDPDTFYFLQIFKRRKDNPDMEKDMKVIRNYHIDSFEKFDKLLPTIIKECDDHNARAYFRLNPRSYKQTALLTLKLIAGYVAEGDHKSPRTAFDKVSGQYHKAKDKTWLIDIDWKDWDNTDDINNLLIPMIHSLQIDAGREPLVAHFPSKNGFHLVTRPFNLQKLKSLFPKLDVHKDNPILLYVP